MRGRSAASTFLVIALAACGGDGPTDPSDNEPRVSILLGAGVTDTIDSQPLQALVVEVREQGGQLTSGAIVRFEAQPPTDPARLNEAAIYVCQLTAITCGQSGGFGPAHQVAIDTSDSQGRAAVMVRLGRVAGPAVVRVRVPELGLADPATFSVTPGAAAGVRAATADTTLDIGATATLRGSVVDRYNNRRPEPPAVSAGGGTAITVDAVTGVVTAREMGSQWLFVRHAAFVDSSRVGVVPPGRLVVWTSDERAVRLVNINGSGSRTIVSDVASDLGAFPRFDATRQRVTLHTVSQVWSGPPDNVIVIDTTGVPRRDIGPTAFSTVIAVRQLANGMVFVVGRRTADPSPAFSVWRVAADNSITLVAPLSGLGVTYGGADISHDGTRVAYLASTASSSYELRTLNVSTGATTVLEPDARSPRWSSQGDRVAYLVPASHFNSLDGVAAVINANGTGRRVMGTDSFSPGLAWSPDGMYLVGRSSNTCCSPALRLVRVSDGANVLLRFRSADGFYEDYFQPDWR